MSNTLNTPVEALERAFPLKVRRCRLRRDSGGAGDATGGDSIERDLEVLADCTASLITERRAGAGACCCWMVATCSPSPPRTSPQRRVGSLPPPPQGA